MRVYLAGYPVKKQGHASMNALIRQTPPRKQAGQGCGFRRIDGAVMDVRTAAAFLGGSEKQLRGMVDRKLIPFRRLGSTRIIFIRTEMEAWLANLPGCTIDQAQENLRVRRGLEG